MIAAGDGVSTTGAAQVRDGFVCLITGLQSSTKHAAVKATKALRVKLTACNKQDALPKLLKATNGHATGGGSSDLSTPQHSPSTNQRQRNIDPRRVQCDKCPYRTRFNYDLAQHRRHHGATALAYTCTHCDYATKSMHHLQRHLVLHQRAGTDAGDHSTSNGVVSGKIITTKVG
jgi:DNA-directed RNA polymerase subunit M/transcription elongation factor TFIIS